MITINLHKWAARCIQGVLLVSILATGLVAQNTGPQLAGDWMTKVEEGFLLVLELKADNTYTFYRPMTERSLTGDRRVRLTLGSGRWLVRASTVGRSVWMLCLSQWPAWPNAHDNPGDHCDEPEYSPNVGVRNLGTLWFAGRNWERIRLPR